MTQLIVTILVIVLSSAFTSSIEAAFFTVSLSRARLLKEQKKGGSESLVYIKEKIHHTIIALVILSNVISVVGSMYVGYLATKLYGGEIGLLSAIMTFLLILFGEIVPKMIGENNAEPIALTFARPMFVFTKILTPLIFLIEFIMKRFMKPKHAISEDELKMLSQMGEQEGSIEKDEQELIQRVFTLNDLTAKDIMTPRTVIEALPASVTVREVSTMITHKPYSRYPVYEDTIDKIVGICQSRDLLIALGQDNDGEIISHFMMAPLFISEKTKVDALLTQFLTAKTHMGIVQDEYGATIGVVTFEDVLEQLVGEIVDETDEIVDLQSHARARHTNKNK